MKPKARCRAHRRLIAQGCEGWTGNGSEFWLCLRAKLPYQKLYGAIEVPEGWNDQSLKKTDLIFQLKAIACTATRHCCMVFSTSSRKT